MVYTLPNHLRHAVCGVPGPGFTSVTATRSQFRGRMCIIHFLIFMILMAHTYKGEGSSGAMARGREKHTMGTHEYYTHSFSKTHGFSPIVCPGTSVGQQSKPIQKRSLKRAYHRACLTGMAWYRGRPYTPTDFPSSVRSDPPPPLQTQPLPPICHKPRDRLTALTRNTSGLSKARFDELRAWLYTQQIDLVVLCETRGSWKRSGRTNIGHISAQGTQARRVPESWSWFLNVCLRVHKSNGQWQ